MKFIPRPSKKIKKRIYFYFRVDVVLRASVVLVLELEVDAPERVDLLSATFGAGLLAGFGAGFAFGAGFGAGAALCGFGAGAGWCTCFGAGAGWCTCFGVE